jgi:hypothetical protein
LHLDRPDALRWDLLFCKAELRKPDRPEARAARAFQKKKPPHCGGFEILAEWTGLEPATPGVTGRYSNQLNYHSMWLAAFPDRSASAAELGVP